MWTPDESSTTHFVLHLVQSQQVIHYWPLRFDLLEKQGKKKQWKKKLKVALHPNKCHVGHILLRRCRIPSGYILLPGYPVGHKEGHPIH